MSPPLHAIGPIAMPASSPSITTSSTSLSLFAAPAADRAANVLAVARALSVHLARSRPLDRKLVSNIMTTGFGGSDAEGVWSWRDAYEAIEAATVLQVRRLAPQVARLETPPPRSPPCWRA